MELGCDGELYKLMTQKKRFSEETSAFIIKELLNGIHYMHLKDVIHRDIKPENIVICQGVPKICDFGSSTHCENSLRTTMCGTPLYCSPEILKGCAYSEKIDVWALGFLAHELVVGENPFKIRRK